MFAFGGMTKKTELLPMSEALRMTCLWSIFKACVENPRSIKTTRRVAFVVPGGIKSSVIVPLWL